LDIGTTTVAIYLVDLNTGKILDAKVSYNKQIAFGEDVITRMMYAQEENGLDKLNIAIKETINDLIDNVAKEENILLSDIYAIQCAGNTTMTHMFLNIPPHNMRVLKNTLCRRYFNNSKFYLYPHNFVKCIYGGTNQCP